MPIRLDEDTLVIAVWQSILRHQPAPGHFVASLEQNPAYGTALTHSFIRGRPAGRPGLKVARSFLHRVSSVPSVT